MTFSGNAVQIKAQSQTAIFRTVMPGKAVKGGELVVQLPDAEDAVTTFGTSDVVCSRLLPKGEALLDGSALKVFFAPMRSLDAKETK
jgi:hypothetical protein